MVKQKKLRKSIASSTPNLTKKRKKKNICLGKLVSPIVMEESIKNDRSVFSPLEDTIPIIHNKMMSKVSSHSIENQNLKSSDLFYNDEEKLASLNLSNSPLKPKLLNYQADDLVEGTDWEKSSIFLGFPSIIPKDIFEGSTPDTPPESDSHKNISSGAENESSESCKDMSSDKSVLDENISLNFCGNLSEVVCLSRNKSMLEGNKSSDTCKDISKGKSILKENISSDLGSDVSEVISLFEELCNPGMEFLTIKRGFSLPSNETDDSFVKVNGSFSGNINVATEIENSCENASRENSGLGELEEMLELPSGKNFRRSIQMLRQINSNTVLNTPSCKGRKFRQSIDHIIQLQTKGKYSILHLSKIIPE